MLTLRTLKELIDTPKRGEKLPTPKQLRTGESPVVAHKTTGAGVNEVHIIVYQSGYAVYGIGNRATVFPVNLELGYICLLRNMKEKSLAVIACDGKDTMSVRVPEGFLELHKSFKIHSKQFVYETLTGWGLDPEKTYSFKGEYLEEQKMVVFCLKTMNL